MSSPRLLSVFPGPVLVVGADGAWRGANDAGEALCAELDGGGADDARAAFARLAQSDEPEAMAQIPLARDGEVRWIEAVATPLDNGARLVLCRDATSDAHMREVLVESRQRYKDLVEVASDFAWETDAEGRLSFVSADGFCGYGADRLIGRDPAALEFKAGPSGEGWPRKTQDPVKDRELWLRAADGELNCVLVSAVPVYDYRGQWCGVRGIGRDVTKERMRDAQLARAQARERTIAYVVHAVRNEVRPGGMLSAAVGATLRSITAAGCGIYQIDEDGELGVSATAGAAPPAADIADDLRQVAQTTTIVQRAIAGRPAVVMALRYRNVVHGVLVVWRTDDAPPWDEDDLALLQALEAQLGIALRQIADQQRLERLSRTDDLTGLLNRRAFMHDARGALARARRNKRPGAMLYLDLDRFKDANDRAGHDVGDDMLARVAQVLLSAVRPYDVVARLGGDEFAIWLDEISPRAAERRANKIRFMIAEALGDLAKAHAGLRDLRMAASIGVAPCDPDCVESVDAVIQRADKAMYMAKQRGRDAVCVLFASGRRADEAKAAVAGASARRRAGAS